MERKRETMRETKQCMRERERDGWFWMQRGEREVLEGVSWKEKSLGA